MACTTVHPPSAWTLARRQHGVVTRRQLLDLGYSRSAIAHRLKSGRLHSLYRGVYAVGRAETTRLGTWMAAVLSCGEGALLSHFSAAALWKIGIEGERIEVSVPASRLPRRPEIAVHRRAKTRGCDRAIRDRIPVTSPIRTLVDLATRLRPSQLERAVNEADKLDLVDAGSLSGELHAYVGEPGIPALRDLLGEGEFQLTDSQLERRFLPIARKAGLPEPQTGAIVCGFKVDFFWPQLGLVVETDGLRYHRTAAEQKRDRLRDQAHTAAGLTTLRFTYHQVAHQPDQVERTLRRVADTLRLT